MVACRMRGAANRPCTSRPVDHDPTCEASSAPARGNLMTIVVQGLRPAPLVLQPLRRNDPDPTLEIDLAPRCPDYLSGSQPSQKGDLMCPPDNPRPCSNCPEESRN